MVKKKIRTIQVDDRIIMIKHIANISIIKQCEMLEVNRRNHYYKPVNKASKYKEILPLVIDIWNDNPTRGARRIKVKLNKKGYSIGRDKVGQLMKELGLEAIVPKRNLSKPNKQHKKYPYLLRGVKITHPNHVWSTDITYIKLARGYVYLVAIIDWYSRKILSWRLSNTLNNSFCIDALNEAIVKYGTPKIFNTDQGTQFTASNFIEILERHNIQISMDGKGRALDNIFIERLWRTVKYEHIFLWRFDSIPELRNSLKDYFKDYNEEREHQSLDYLTPDEVYYNKRVVKVA